MEGKNGGKMREDHYYQDAKDLHIVISYSMKMTFIQWPSYTLQDRPAKAVYLLNNTQIPPRHTK